MTVTYSTDAASSDILVSVVIPHGHIGRPIDLCVSALAKQSLDRDLYEIIVVLDGIELNQSILDKLLLVGCKVLEQDKAGVCTTRNRGIAEAEAELIILIDDDCIAEQRFLEAYVMYFSDNTEISGAGGTVLPMRGESIIAQYAAYRKLLSHPIMTSDKVLSVVTANGGFRRSALLSIGMFDTRLDEYFRSCGGDDVDLSFRLRQEGHTLGFCPEAIVSHRHREQLSDFVVQQARNGKGLYAHCHLRKRSLKSLGMPEANIPSIVVHMLMSIVTSHPERGRSLISKIARYVADDNLNWYRKLVFTACDIIKTGCYYYGMYSAKRLLSSRPKKVGISTLK